MKKWLTMVMVLVLVLSLTACTSSKSTNSAQSSNSSGSKWVNGKYEPAITLSTVYGIASNVVYKKGETVQNNVNTRLIKDRLGINMKFNWVVTDTNDAYKTKLRLMLSSGEKMPDVVRYRGDAETVNMLIDSGQFMPVGDLVKKYANDTYKQGLALDPTIWYPITRNGKKMALPILDYAYNGNETLWIRTDWLKKLGLQPPKTLADMAKVMNAFVNDDPDGNGKKDTYGLAVGLKNGYSSWMTDAGFVFGAYGAIPGSWDPNSSGKLVNGSIQPQAKQALATLKDWMSKGYISKDAATQDETTASKLFTSGKAGMMMGPNWIPAWPIPDLIKNNPKATYEAIPLPKGPTGLAGAAGNNPPSNGYLFINKDCKHPEAVLRYYNFFFDNFANPQPGSEFANGFAKGYDYAVTSDGKVIRTTDEAKKHPDLFPGVDLSQPLPDPLFYSLTYEGARIPDLYAKEMVRIANGGKVETPFDKTEIAPRPPENIQGMKVIMDQKDEYIKNYFMGPLTDTMKSKNELLNKLVNEAYTKIVYGQAPLSSFDKMVETWKKDGGDKITQEVNDWYATVK